MVVKNYPQSVKDKALKLWVQGYSIESIGKMEGMPSKQTLWRWRKEYKWSERKKKALEKSESLLDEELTDIIVRQRKIVGGLLGKSLRVLSERLDKKDPKSVSIKDIIELLKHELLIEGRVTERKEISVRDEIRKAYEELVRGG